MALSKYIMQPTVGRDVQRYLSAEFQKIEKAIASIIIDSEQIHTSIEAITANLTWNNVTYLNNWGSYDPTEADWGRAQYAKDALGFVHLRGLVKNTIGTIFDTAMFTMPVGYRPQHKNHMYAVVLHNGTAYSMGRLDVDVNGNAVCRPTGAASVAFMQLHGVTFYAGN